MKRAVLLLIVALFLSSVTVSMTNMISNLSEFSPPHLTKDIVVSGKAHHFLLAQKTWEHFPPRPWPLFRFVDLRALGLMAVAMSCVYIVARVRMRWSYSMVGLLCLIASAVPYSLGAVALSNNTVPENAGPWLVTMLLGVLYGSMTCGVLV